LFVKTLIRKQAYAFTELDAASSFLFLFQKFQLIKVI